MTKRTYVFDSEIYRNYFLVGFMNIANDKVWSVECVGEKSVLSKEDRIWLRDFMRKPTVGFNSNNFDLPVIYAAIAGRTVGDLKRIANNIIVDGMKPWDIEKEWGFEIPRDLDHIDLIEPAPGAASLKIFNGRLHGKRMQDLPIHHDAVLTEEEIEVVYDYWENDLQATKLLHGALKVHLDLRTELSKLYKRDLRSKSDAQVAEAIIKSEIEKLTGQRLKKPEFKRGQTFFYKAPPYIKFKNEQLQDILATIEAWEFRVQPTGKVEMPAFLSDARIEIGTSVYRMGIGGLHSSEEKVCHVESETHLLGDFDVTSFYPNIIITLGLYPETLGKIFLKVYKGILDRRIKAKRRQQEIEAEIKALEAKLKEMDE